MSNAIRNFLTALDKEEKTYLLHFARDNLGILLRSVINEFDLFHYNYYKADNRNLEQSEQYYIIRLGMTRAIRLALEARESYDVPTVTFSRRRDLSLHVLGIVSALGMIEHGRRIAHSTKTGLCEINQIDQTSFEFTLPSVLPDEAAHERSLVEHYANETRRSFDEGMSSAAFEGVEKSVEELLHELVYVFMGSFIGYKAHPILDGYFFALGYHELQLQEGFDTFHYSTMFGGVRFQKYVLATAYLISLSIKHRRFCEALVKKSPHIKMEDILTITSERPEFVQSLADALNYFGSTFEGHKPTTLVEAETIADVLSLSRENVSMIKRPVAPIPCLIRSSDTALIRLLAGASTEPMQFLLHSLRHHFPKEYDKHQQKREGPFQRAVMRELSAAFHGLEFRQNIKIRRDGRELTDIDLVAIDRATGSIVLCQLKYQDLYGADILSASSHHSRLKKETSHWLKAVEGWLGEVGNSGLRSAFHLSKGFNIRMVYRLVLSKHYAYPLKDVLDGEDSAFANWIQLFNALALMKRDQGTFRTIGGLINLLQRQNSEVKLQEHLAEPPTRYSIGPLSFSVRQAE